VVFDRLLGQETEYAIRFSPERRHPGNDVIYDALATAIASRVKSEPGLYPQRSQIFIENGGAFHYESVPYCDEGGLIEGATPECRGPAQLLVYQKAQEALLLASISDAEGILRSSGFPGKLGLLKNCRDAEGHVYGAQESFEVALARGMGLVLYRVGLAALLPLLAITVVVYQVLSLLLTSAMVVGAAFAAVVGALPPLRRRGLLSGLRMDDRSLDNAIGRSAYWLTYRVTWPFIASFSALLSLVAFRPLRRHGTAFVVSRAILSGAGTLDDGSRFLLSEKGPAIGRVMKLSIRPDDRAIFDTGNLTKPVLFAAHFQWEPLFDLFRRSQRVQMGLADSNMLQEAEFLKAGSTALVLDMIDGGFLADAPRVERPVDALHAIVSDPALEAKVATDRGPLSALEIQKYYLDRAEEFVRASRATSLEALEVVRLWRTVLRSLEAREMNDLVGRLDWVTKRYLLESCGDERDRAQLKTLDLRYHELGEGYAAKLEKNGFTRRIVGSEEVARATTAPPEGTPAFSRGRFIRTRERSLAPVVVSWGSARVGGRFHGTVVRFPSMPPRNPPGA
jgi:Pup amidohydrolase